MKEITYNILDIYKFTIYLYNYTRTVKQMKNTEKKPINKTNTNQDKYAIIKFIFLLFCMIFLQYIPLIILRIDPKSIPQNIAIIYNFIIDLIVILIIIIMYKKRIITEFKSYIKNFGNNIETSFKYYIPGFILMVISNIAIVFFFKEANANNEEAVRTMISLFPAYMIFSVSIYAPFVEETIFRRCIKDTILSLGNNKLTKYIYVFISGFIFAVLHIIGSATQVIDYIYIFPYISLGISFALLYYKTDNIFSTVIMHSMHNTVAIILYILSGVV